MPLASRTALPRARRSVAALAALILVTTGLAACSAEGDVERDIDAFLNGWTSGSLHDVGFLNPAGQRIAADTVATEIAGLVGDLGDTPPKLSRSGDVRVQGNGADAAFSVQWTLPGDVAWSYTRPIRLQRGADDRWQVIWEPALVHEGMTSGDRLAVTRLTAARAAVLDGVGEPIVAPRPVVTVGVEPQAAENPRQLARDLDAALKAVRPRLTPAVDVSDLPARLAEAKPDAFVEVVTLRREAYDQIKPRIYDLPGTRFREGELNLAPTREFARALLGSVDQATAEDLAAKPEVYAAGDLVGHGGLQGRYDERLRGGTGVGVSINRPGPDGTVTTTEIFRQEPAAGAPVRTTLDVATQNAADAALHGEKRRASVVAIRISDGAVLATANGPGAAGQNLAFTAQVPPGSTFKMVSTLGLLDAGAVKLDTPVACPKTFTVEGRSFKNANNFALGRVPFRTDFAESCNTAFAALAPKLGPDGLAAAGRSLGLEGQWDLGLEAFSGKVSTGGPAVEQAAASFGQGTTLVSPLAMASATAAVARGHAVQPKLLLDPVPGSPAADGAPLNAESVAALRTMMREVVTKGTATSLARVPGGPVHGKTGTAEYDDNPAHTHAWFVGWQGDVAFAVFVEQGGGSGDTAVPIAGRFLRGLNR